MCVLIALGCRITVYCFIHYVLCYKLNTESCTYLVIMHFFTEMFTLKIVNGVQKYTVRLFLFLTRKYITYLRQLFHSERMYFIKGIECRIYCKHYLQNFQYYMDIRELRFLFSI